MSKLVFKKAPKEESEKKERIGYWKILIVDDEEEIHKITVMILSELIFEKRELSFLHAYSGDEAKKIMQKHSDISVILLDVVMESDEAGLDVARYIREELKNKFVRIILRTGQPGKAPEKKVIIEYDINDYKAKPELTSERLYTTLIASLRSYRDLRIIEKNRIGLEKIVDSSARIFEMQSLRQFAYGVLTQLISILKLDESSLYLKAGGFTALAEENDFTILAATGDLENTVGKHTKQMLPDNIQNLLIQAVMEKRSFFSGDTYVGYFSTSSGLKYLLYLKGCNNLSDLDKDLIRIFATNVAIAFENINLNEKLEHLVEDRTAKLRKANIELQKATDRAWETAKAKSEFLASMSHEIRTPMNAVIAASDFVLSKNIDPEIMRCIKLINSSGYALLGIINDILDFSKIEAGKLNLESIPFSLDELISNTLEMFRYKANEKNIQLLFDIQKGTPLVLVGDPLRIQQIIVNILGNAVKFTNTGGIIYFNISSHPMQTSNNKVILTFSIKDSGIGIAPENLKRLFQAYSQAESSTSRKYGGTGLGLVICKQLVELMNGEIWAESKAGQGTTFFFTVPFIKQSDIQKLEVKNLSKDEKYPYIKNQISEIKQKLKGIRILLAEDNLTNQEIMRAILKDAEIKVDIANNGNEAIKAIYNNIKSELPYNLVLMDVQMPEMDGFEACINIRKDPKLDTLPIIALTAHAMQGDEERCRRAGMDGYVSKPIKQITLFETMLNIIESQNSSTFTERNRILHAKSNDILEQQFDIPHKLPGLNIKKAMNELHPISGNDFRKILQHFYLDNQTTMLKIKDAFLKNDWKTLRNIVNCQKGNSVSIGAYELQEALQIVEISCMERTMLPPSLLIINRVESALNQVLESIKTIIEFPKQEKDKIEIETSIDKEKVSHILKKLSDSIEIADPEEITKCMDLLKELIGRNIIQETESLINDYEYEAAMTALKKIAYKYE
ncbi:MAG: DUF3369 domain-containing protein [Desulfobacterales bacterium]|nr:DUF3369 domain-containing protein [Desulfobacterales bacterium]